jgi:hypothetical protein
MRKFTMLFLLLSASLAVHAQKTKLSESQVKELVDGGSYFFRAQNMYPSGGRSRVLTEINYTMTVKPGEVDADLPYVGRAQQAPVNPTDIGVKFNSKDFILEKKDAKKGGWDISISPKDVSDVRICFLTVHTNGNANLNITFNSKQSISYQGVIMPLEEKK